MTASADDDPALRAAVRQALAAPLEGGPAASDRALEQRVLADWAALHAPAAMPAADEALAPAAGARSPPPPPGLGPWIRKPSGRASGPGGRFGALALLLAVVALAAAYAWTQRPDPAVDELLRIDVLSQIAAGEL